MSQEKLKLEPKVKKVYQINLYRKWRIVAICWLTLGIFSIWELRHEIALWQDYFTWSALRYALAYHRLASLSFSICLGLTIGLLISQCRDILWGISEQEKYRLTQELEKLCNSGKFNP
jgi:hypothetical protein